MANFHIVNDRNTGILYLIDDAMQSCEKIDRDIINSTGLTGIKFIRTVDAISDGMQVEESSEDLSSHYVIKTEGYRSDPSDRMTSASPVPSKTIGTNAGHNIYY